MVTVYYTMKATMNQLLHKQNDVQKKKKKTSQVLTLKFERKAVSYEH